MHCQFTWVECIWSGITIQWTWNYESVQILNLCNVNKWSVNCSKKTGKRELGKRRWTINTEIDPNVMKRESKPEGERVFYHIKQLKGNRRREIGSNPDDKTAKSEEPKKGKHMQNKKKQKRHKWKERMAKRAIEEKEELTRVKAKRYGSSLLQELLTKRARHACFKRFPLHSHHLTRHSHTPFSLHPFSKPHWTKHNLSQIHAESGADFEGQRFDWLKRLETTDLRANAREKGFLGKFRDGLWSEWEKITWGSILGLILDTKGTGEGEGLRFRWNSMVLRKL